MVFFISIFLPIPEHILRGLLLHEIHLFLLVAKGIKQSTSLCRTHLFLFFLSLGLLSFLFLGLLVFGFRLGVF